MLLLGEQQAADIIRYLDPKEVQGLGAAMVGVADLSQEAVNIVLDDFVSTIKKQTNLGLGTTDYVESVLKRALGEDKASSVLGRIMPGSSSKGLEILRWMDARSIAEMIVGEHPQVVAIILSVVEYDVAADVLNFLPAESRPEIIQRVASLETATFCNARVRRNNETTIFFELFCTVLEFWWSNGSSENYELHKGRS